MSLSDILTISVENLSEEDKDELYNALVWLDCKEKDLDNENAVDLIKIYQDVMKFKGEQVEALIAELDELAIKQGEEEAAKDKINNETNFQIQQSTFQIQQSTNSREFEELEKKYKDLKHKFKSLQKKNEDQRETIERLETKMKEIEDEKIELIREMQAKGPDGESSDDVSESIKEKQTELLNSIHEKNNHISRLLRDIQSAEEENDVLREKVTNLRDNLKEATDHINLLTSEINSYKAKVKENDVTIGTLQKENVDLKDRFNNVVEEKKHIEKQGEEFAQKMTEKFNKLQELLNEKESVIKQLKASRLERKDSSGSKDTDSRDVSKKLNLHLDVLTKTVVEKDEQIMQLQKQLQGATEEMELTTDILERITKERDRNLKKVTELSGLIKTIKEEKQKGHERCVDLQKQVEYLEDEIKAKTDELNNVLNKLKEGGHSELSSIVRETSKMKTNIRFLEKQVSDYVRMCNKLQKNVDKLENENSVLREKLDIPVDEEVFFKGIVLKPVRHKKEQRKLENYVRLLEDEKVNLKIEIEKSKRAVNKLSAQIINLGEEPIIEGITIDKFGVASEEDNKENYKELVEENEALRQGLHEIMNCINLQKGSPFLEIKADSLERLLKALDVKHVSGWYHPAMRLQAEVHSLRGGNTELRDQLRLTRLELLKLKSDRIVNDGVDLKKGYSDIYTGDDVDFPEDISGKTEKLISYLNNSLVTLIRDCSKADNLNIQLTEEMNRFKKEFSVADAQMKIFYDRYISEKMLWEKDKETWDKEREPLKEKVEVLQAKLEEYLDPNGEFSNKERAVELAGKLVVLNRKCIFLENSDKVNKKEIDRLKTELKLSEDNALFRIKILNSEIRFLRGKCDELLSSCLTKIDKRKFDVVKNDLESLTIKYRELLDDLKSFKDQSNKEVCVLSKTVEVLNNEKKELHIKLIDSLSKITEEQVTLGNTDLKTISNKLAQCEVNEINERQRANHMTNLYELVKEQLQKLEERFKDSEKYSKQLVEKNFLLQKDLKELEDKEVDHVSPQMLSDLQYKYSRTIEDMEKIVNENKLLTEELLQLKEKSCDRYDITLKDMEILNLKHQLVDLQSSSDEKAMLARLSSDVVLARMAENEHKKKLEETETDLKETKENYEECRKVLEEQKAKLEGLDSNFNNKLRNLEEMLYKKRLQYLGCTPLVSDELYVLNLCQVFRDKRTAFESLQNVQRNENETLLMKKQFEEKMLLFDELIAKIGADGRPALKEEKLKNWFMEINTLKANKIKNAGEVLFKDEQLKQVKKRLSSLEQQCMKLEEELFYANQRNCSLSDKEIVENIESEALQSRKDSSDHQNHISSSSSSPEFQNSVGTLSELIKYSKVLKKTAETQTVLELRVNGDGKDEIIGDLQDRILVLGNDIVQKDNALSEMRSKIIELEMTLNMFRTQIADKHSQITFYEKHILELQNKISSSIGDSQKSPLEQNNIQEVKILRARINDLEDVLTRKETSLNDLQILIKNDRDEHSLAAVRMQQEVQRFQNMFENQQKAYEELHDRNTLLETERTEVKSRYQEKSVEKNAIENYISQVHQLEKHTCELHTTVASLASQLQASREESVRWKTLANERLQNMDLLRQNLEKQHEVELLAYKEENEKWRKEVIDLQQTVTKYRLEFKDIEPDIVHKLKEKDDKIHELTATITNIRFEARKNLERVTNFSKATELDSKNQQLSKEVETLKKHLDQTITREKNAREEIRQLKNQLMKRPLSIKSDRSDKEQHLQKKVNSMEVEIQNLKDKLNDQIMQNENHKLLVADDFDKWKKQKLWQQKAEKLKDKLKERENENDKLQQTCSGYRILIERLEKEKHSLENKMKYSHHGIQLGDSHLQMEELRRENVKLNNEIENIRAKFQMQQHHSGALGAAMMQEKLEAQERKIAILELTSKSSAEVRGEMERLQSTVSTLQKANCSLEAENLEKKLDLEKYERELPHLKDRIQYLENYLKVLNEERSKHVVTGSGDQGQENENDKKVSQLEKTIFALKRVIEKLQVENKRLLNKDKVCSARSSGQGSDKLKGDLMRTREQLIESTKVVSNLEKQLELAMNKIKCLESGEEISRLNSELTQKAILLDKVKTVLCRAAAKEKALVEEIAMLKREINYPVRNNDKNEAVDEENEEEENAEKLVTN